MRMERRGISQGSLISLRQQRCSTCCEKSVDHRSPFDNDQASRVAAGLSGNRNRFLASVLENWLPPTATGITKR